MQAFFPPTITCSFLPPPPPQFLVVRSTPDHTDTGEAAVLYVISADPAVTLENFDSDSDDSELGPSMPPLIHNSRSVLRSRM